MEDSFRYIPAEIILNILPNLPGKSLLRFRCVCKDWSGWISETKLCQGKKIISRSLTEENTVLFRTVDEKLQVKDIDLSRYKLKPRKSCIRASCDGLLLINVYNDLFLWNPTIHSCRKVLSININEEYFDDYRFVAGLCFDSYDDAYKVVMAVSSCNMSPFSGEYVLVGSSRTNSWERISIPYSISSLVSGPVLNNYLHWYASDERGFSNSHKIIYFEPKNNSFYEVPMPDPKGEYGDWIHGLGVLDGSLCMARREQNETAEVLVMKEYGVKESWQTLFKIGGEIGTFTYLIPFFYTEKKGQVLMKFGDEIVTVDMLSGEKDVNMKGKGYFFEETMVEPCDYLNEDWKSNCSISITRKMKKVIVPGSQHFLFQSINQLAEVEDIEIQGVSNTPKVLPYIYGSFKGFLLIRFGIRLFLWNTTFGYREDSLSCHLLTRYPPTEVVSGLCLDSDNRNFKVVLVLDHHNWRERWVVVGSFETNSWSEISTGQFVTRNLKSGPTLNNHLHFWSSNADSSDQIIYFDPKTDNFMKIPLPDQPSWNKRSCIRGLGVWDRSLCMVCSDSSYNNHKIYEMKEYGVKESWTCMFQFDYKNCSRATPLFFSDEEKSELLIYATRSDGYAAIVSCDIGNRQYKEIVVLNVEAPKDGPFVYEVKLGTSISLLKKKAGNTTSNSQNRPKKVWYIRDDGLYAKAIWNNRSKATKTEIGKGKKGKKAAAHMSNTFSLLSELKEEEP